MKTQNPKRIGMFTTFLEHIQTALNSETFTTINSDALADQLSMPGHVVKRGLMLLERDFSAIDKKQRGVFRAKPALFEVTGEMLDKALLDYQRMYPSPRKGQEAAEAEEGKQLKIEPVMSAAESTFASQQYNANITNGSALTLGELLSPIRDQYGFELQGQTRWFATKVQAATEAQLMAIKHDIEQVELIQKVGVVVNRPTVTYFT